MLLSVKLARWYSPFSFNACKTGEPTTCNFDYTGWLHSRRGMPNAASAKLEPYVAAMKMNYPVLLGKDRDDVQDAFGPLVGIPVTVVISRDGKVCTSHAGLTGKDSFEQEIKALL
jgi:hypothetical protein